MDSISRQKKYLSENLIVESLRMYDVNRKDIQEFSQAKYGNIIAEYLKDKAWNDDQDNDTRIFLVRDKKTRKIAYYYALSCGILYKELNTKKMTLVEQVCVEKLIIAIRRTQSKAMTADEEEAAYALLVAAYELFDEKIEDSDRASTLICYAREQAEIKKERSEVANQIDDSAFVKNVQETYPAIDIKFLCRDANYEPDINLNFKFGVYIFWEIIVPHILKIAELVGCKYIYLFAADHSEEDVKKLVSYYINNLKFRPVSEYTILKPHYELECYTLIQDVSELEYKRELIWLSHEKV